MGFGVVGLSDFAGSEDAGYPRQDGKTPWSFTLARYWDSILHVQDRRETEKL